MSATTQHSSNLNDNWWQAVVNGVDGVYKTWEGRVKGTQPWKVGDTIMFTNRTTGENSPLYLIDQLREYLNSQEMFADLGQALLPGEVDARIYSNGSIPWKKGHPDIDGTMAIHFVPVVDTFTVKLGEPIYINILDVTFKVVSAEDSRCPEFASCVWEGQVELKVSITGMDSVEHIVDMVLHIADGSTISIGQYNIQIIKVDRDSNYTFAFV